MTQRPTRLCRQSSLNSASFQPAHTHFPLSLPSPLHFLPYYSLSTFNALFSPQLLFSLFLYLPLHLGIPPPLHISLFVPSELCGLDFLSRDDRGIFYNATPTRFVTFVHHCVSLLQRHSRHLVCREFRSRLHPSYPYSTHSRRSLCLSNLYHFSMFNLSLLSRSRLPTTNYPNHPIMDLQIPSRCSQRHPRSNTMSCCISRTL